ncbi:hypothetical protein GCM10023187_46550 [Nibrella viscosa]|uniref:Lysine transporter LysE n=1 Tax=Nibrella viscosa TaxID=1084524 RepID=A0ABP8KSY9_9BACT
MHLLWLNFGVGLLVSFLGTLPLGVLNLTIVRVSIRQGIRSAFWFALACALVEWVYSYLAVLLSQALLAFMALKIATDFVSVAVLLGMGVYYLRRRGTATTGTSIAFTWARF